MTLTPRVLTINGGSSSIKFALFEVGESLRRTLRGGIERIGLPEATFNVAGMNQKELRRFSPFDPEHLPEEIGLTETFHHRFPDLPQVACCVRADPSTVVSERMRRRFAPEFARGWDSWASYLTKSGTPRMAGWFPRRVAALRFASSARTRNE